MMASLRRIGAMILKEFVQLRRDRVTFATMIMIPLMQLVLFGYAINTTPRDMPTAVLLQESSDVGRSILAALRNTNTSVVTHQVRDAAEFDRLLQSGTGAVRAGNPGELRARAAPRAIEPASSSRRTRPIRWRQARRCPRWRRSSTRRWRTISACRRRARPRSRSAPMRATTRRDRASSTSCPACSAPS
jgi:hypothetical protein